MNRVSMLIVGVLMSISGMQGALLERPWTKVQISPFVQVADAAAVDRYTLYGVGPEGSMSITTDGGKIWKALDSESGGIAYNDVCFDPITGVTAVGAGGIVTFRINGAPSTLHLDEDYTFTGVAAKNGVILIAGTDENDALVIVRSTDNGSTATRVVVYGARETEEGFGSPFIMYSSDAGQTWHESVIQGSYFAVTAVAGNGTLMTAVGVQDGSQQPGYYRSLDGARTWEFRKEDALAYATDIVRLDAGELSAIAMRVAGSGEGAVVIQSEVYSVDGGQNWNIRDIADGGGALRLVRAGDRLLAVGAEGALYRRWYDKQPQPARLTPLTRHLEMGAMDHQQPCEQRTFAVAVNTGGSVVRVTSINLADVDGEKGVGFFPAEDLMPGDTLYVVLTVTPENLGEFWSALEVRFNHETVLAWPVHGISTTNSSAKVVQLVEPYLDLSSILDMETQEPGMDVFTNVGSESLEVTEVGISGDDVLAFAIADLELPVIVGPGETFSLTLNFEPYSKGVYTSDIIVTTTAGVLHVPAVARVREDVYENVFNLGTSHVEQGLETTVQFQHRQDNNAYTVQTIYGPRSPFEVRWTTSLPAEVGPEESIDVNVRIKPDQNGSYASVIGVPFSFGVSFDARVERRVFVAMFGAPTSVDEDEDRTWTSWRLLDLSGRVIAEGALHSGAATPQPSLDNLPSGLYLLSLTGPNGMVTRKFTKN
jgi:photosystem II stability/assembly factor-like uncharacterized protein